MFENYTFPLSIIIILGPYKDNLISRLFA